MYFLKYVSVFLLMTLCVFGAQAKTVTVDGSSCSKCQFESLLGNALGTVGGVLGVVDDIVIKNCAVGTVMTIAKPLVCRTLTITSGTVNLLANVALKGDLVVNAGANILVNGALTSTGLINLDGNMLIQGGISQIGQLNCNGQLKVEAGSLTLNGLLAAATSTPIVTGGSLINNGKCIYNSIPAVSGAAQFVINGATTLTKGINVADKSILSIGAKAVADIQHDSIISTPINVAAAGEVKLTKGTHNFNGINGATNSLMTIVDGAVQMNGPSKCDKVNMNGAGSILVNSNSEINNIIAAATAKINVAKTALLNINGKADINTIVNLADTSKIIAGAKSTVNLLGGIASTAGSQVHAMDNSILNMAKTCTLSQPIVIGKQATVNLNQGSHDLSNGIDSQPTSTINVAKDSHVKTGKSCKMGNINVLTGANLNINSGTAIVQGALNTADNSAIAVTNAILNLKGASTCKSPLNIGAAAQAIFDAQTNLHKGIIADATANLAINHAVNVLGAADIKALTNVNANGLLVFGGSKDITHKCSGSIIANAKSTVNVAGGAILHLDGDATLSGIHKLIDGSQIVVNGKANIVSGINSVGSALSHFTVGPTGKCVLGNIPMPTLPGFPSFPMSSGSSFPSSGASTPSSGASSPSSGNSMPSSGASFPSSGNSMPSSGNSMPSSGASTPSSSGASFPSSGNSMPSSGNSFPSSGASTPSSSGNSFPSSGNSFPSSGNSFPSSGNSFPSSGASTPSSSGASFPTSGASFPSGSSHPSSPSIINGNIIVNAGGALDVLGKCNVGQTLQNSGSLIVTQPIVVAGNAFTQSGANAVCNLVAGGSIDAKVVDFVKGSVNGVGALKCGTCNFANQIAANLNIVGNVKMAQTATIVANLDTAIAAAISKATAAAAANAGKTMSFNKTFNWAASYVPMIACSGTAEIAGNVNVVASSDSVSKLAQGTVFNFVKAPTVKGSFANVNSIVGTAAGSAVGAAGAATSVAKGSVSKVWSLVHSPCACECGFKYQ